MANFDLIQFCGVDLDAHSGGLGISVGLVDDNDLFKWDIIFEGPSDTIYEVSARIPDTFSLTQILREGRLLQGSHGLPPRLPQQPARDEVPH